MTELTPKHMAQIEAALAAGWRLEAIKVYREATGETLHEAKAFIDAMIPALVQRDPNRYGKLTRPDADSGIPSSAGCLVAAFALLGVIFCSVGIYKAVGPTCGTQRVIGTVVAIEEDPSEVAAVAQVVEYEVDGQRYRVKGWGADRTSCKVGQHVPVLYKVRQPSEGYVATFGSLWLFPLAFGGFGVVILAMAYLVWRSARRRKRVLDSASTTA